jgi:hypothetical protein
MKQAILITTYKDFEQLIELINEFDDTFNIYIHIDKKSEVSLNNYKKLKNINNVKYLGNDFKVNWGGVNHLKAYLRLSEIALREKENSFFHLITGQDYPIKNSDHFKSILKNTKCNYLEHFKIPSERWSGGGIDRLENYNLYDTFNAKKSLKWINLIVRFQKNINYKRSISKSLGELHGGSTYWSLTREVLQYVLDFTHKNKKIFKSFNYTFCAEEIYFQTVIMNSPYNDKVVNDSARFIDWESGKGGYPAFLDETDFKDIINSNKLFVRKIDRNRNKLFQMLKDHNSIS